MAGFGKRREPVEVEVQCFGEKITVKMRPLSALEVDEIKQAYPPPLAPRKEIDGAVTIDTADEAYRRADTAWSQKFLLLQIARQIVSDNFTSDDPEERVRELQESFTYMELAALGTQALLVGRGDITAKHMEAARQALVPFENAGQEGAPTAP